MPHKSLYPPVDIPNVDLWTLLFERDQLPFPEDKEIFTDGQTGRTLTFAALRSNAVSFGKGLKALWRNWKRGDVIALYSPNHIDVPVVICGALWAGAVITPASPLYTAKELAFQLKDSGAKALITQLAFLPQALEAAEKAGIPQNRVILLGDKRDPEGRIRHFVSVRATAYTRRYVRALWGGDKRGRGVRSNIDPRDELAVLVYSSGTTGLPKGVMLSHGNVVSNIVQSASIDGRSFLPYGGIDGKGDKHLGVTPFFHIYGLTCCMFQSMFLGWQLVVMERFDIEQACRLIEKYRLTFAYVPPPIILAFGKHPVVSKYDLSSLRLLHSGGAPLTRELSEGLWNRLKLPTKQGYGLSETSPVTHIQTPTEGMKFLGSVGKLIPNLSAKIVDPDGKEVEDGEEGELWVKGPNIYLGYWRQPDKTKETMSDDGYFKTGDVFKKDKHGNFYCTDRVKELIKYNAFQVAPAELEGLLLGHEHIQDAAVIGVWNNAAATEFPRAYVVLHGDHARDEAKAKEIAEWAANQTAPHKRLRGGVVFVDQVPKSPSGKILRRVLREQAKKEARQEGPKL